MTRACAVVCCISMFVIASTGAAAAPAKRKSEPKPNLILTEPLQGDAMVPAASSDVVILEVGEMCEVALKPAKLTVNDQPTDVFETVYEHNNCPYREFALGFTGSIERVSLESNGTVHFTGRKTQLQTEGGICRYTVSMKKVTATFTPGVSPLRFKGTITGKGAKKNPTWCGATGSVELEGSVGRLIGPEGHAGSWEGFGSEVMPLEG
jgi:hypothetical protein